MSATEWNNLSSGLLGAAIGAVLGFLDSVFLNWWNDRQGRKAAGRAVLAEMFANLDRALSAESTRVLHEFLDSAWHTQLPLAAQLLKWPDLKKLVSAYDSASRGYENAKDEIRKLDDRQRNLRVQPRVMGEELKRDRQLAAIENERQKIDGWFRVVAGEWITAMRVVRDSAVECDERKVFDEDLRKLEERLKSANALGSATVMEIRHHQFERITMDPEKCFGKP